MKKTKTIDQLLKMEERELYIELALGLSNTFGLDTPKNERALLSFAQTWYQESRESLIEAICNSKNIQKYFLKENKSNKVEIVAAIADIISELWFGVPPFVLSVLIFKEGLNKICK